MIAVIIPCGSAKRKGKHKAQNLYVGCLFRANLKWALSVAAQDMVFILSAKHGLLKLTDEVETYDLKMGQQGSVSAEKVRSQFEALNLKDATVYALGGLAYVSKLKSAGISFCAPVTGLSMGQMMSVLKRNFKKLPQFKPFEA